mmetsp:Transcript_5425/g.20641  ORF Transcript_5425/g.20641 Transcript_5425/m.20641 type:complete len:319 (+) Transcript_5425:1609-2565(+)
MRWPFCGARGRWLQERAGSRRPRRSDPVERHARGRAQPFEHLAGNLAQRQHLVGGAGRNGFARHAEDDAARFVLAVVVGAGVLHDLHRLGTVGAHAGQHDADRIRPDDLGSRQEQSLDRRLVPVDRIAILHAGDVVGAAALHGQVQAARRDIAMAGQDALAVLSLLDADLAQAVQARGIALCEAGRHVLGDDDGRAVGGQVDQHVLGGLGATGRCADEDELLGGRLAQAGHRDRLDRRCGRRARRGRCRSTAYVCLGRDADLVRDVLGQLPDAVGNTDLGLGDKVDRAQLQRLERDLGAALGQRGHHHHRHRPQAHQA